MAPVTGDVGGEAPVLEEAAALDEGMVMGARGVHELEEPLGEGFLDVIELRVQGAIRGLSVEREGIDLVSRSPHGTFRHGGIGWRLPDESDANPTAPVGHAEIREPPIIAEEVGRARDWSLRHGGGTKSASESCDLVPLILHNVAEGGHLVEEGSGGGLGDPLQLSSVSIGAIRLKEGEGRAR